MPIESILFLTNMRFVAYAAKKGAVETLTFYLARELGPPVITANVIAPGTIETNSGGCTVRDNPQVNRSTASQKALGRAGLPDKIGAVFASLLAPANGLVTALRIDASGDMYL